MPPPPGSTLFPYTTLFRSRSARRSCRRLGSAAQRGGRPSASPGRDRKSTRLNSSHLVISYAVFCLKKNSSDLVPLCDQSRSLAVTLATGLDRRAATTRVFV